MSKALAVKSLPDSECGSQQHRRQCLSQEIEACYDRSRQQCDRPQPHERRPLHLIALRINRAAPGGERNDAHDARNDQPGYLPPRTAAENEQTDPSAK